MIPYGLLADLLDYPNAELLARVDKCVTEVNGTNADAARTLAKFRDSAAQVAAGRLEEIYTATFDLQAARSLYVGHHLFGEDLRRNLFLARLSECYREHRFSPGNELPDHLGVMLRFLASGKYSAEKEELIRVCIIPALSKIVDVLASGDLYQPLIEALFLVLRDVACIESPGEREAEKACCGAARSRQE